MQQLSRSQARRVALAAQGFTDPRPTGRVDRRHLRRVLDRMGVVQIDSVNVLVRSQELPLFARLGPHPRSLIPDATAAGELFEYWVHEACHVPAVHHPLWRWRMAQTHRWRDVARIEEHRPGFVTDVLRRIEREGAVTSSDLEQRVGKKGTWWDWDDGKVALEYLFWTGRLAATRRAGDFARVYDLVERVLPSEVLALPTPPERDARKELLLLAARHHGVGTLDDLADYHRQKLTPARPLVDELVEEGRLVEVQVEGWSKPAYLHPDVAIPRRVRARALLSPFDPVVWYRERALRLFGFHYRIEIYTPQPKRQYGYYVLPFLLGEHLVARVDLKADRGHRTLLVQGAFAELGVPVGEVAEALAAELALMVAWLDLDEVTVADRGDLAAPLRDALAHYARR
ncbi:MAG: winged helix-turn-helix domain-containing protein [Actinobacteria bacterium]|uniref:Unannotated protein n=1 Tax=freshwater metagenome TaxID=449393 RepID=A0A6J6E8X0_9ZZZZ|nr:winged helix-turn-helix domain-containing protein [Actinomycetota bacterium]